MAVPQARGRNAKRPPDPAPARSLADANDTAGVNPCESLRSAIDTLLQRLRPALEDFLQRTLALPENAPFVTDCRRSESFPQVIWRETQILLYRLLCLLRVESRPDLIAEFSSFATAEWHRRCSLTNWKSTTEAERLGAATAETELVSRIRLALRRLSRGGRSAGVTVTPWGGDFFSRGSTPILDQLAWDSESVAALLAVLIQVPHEQLSTTDLSRLYESLLDADPLITSAPMSRVRRGKVEVIVPRSLGNTYRRKPSNSERGSRGTSTASSAVDGSKSEKSPEAYETSGVVWVADLPPDCFVLRTSLHRKGAGAYYTPPTFVRFLVEQSLGAAVRERSSGSETLPAEILKLKVLDPAMGTGAFLLEACRFLGQQLLEACRICVTQAESSTGRAAIVWKEHVTELPQLGERLFQRLLDERQSQTSDPRLLARTERLCRQLVARHCLYGVDKNPLSVSVARWLLWLEAGTAEVPQSFMDMRLIAGDSLAGPLLKNLNQLPGDSQQRLAEPLQTGLQRRIELAVSRCPMSGTESGKCRGLPTEIYSLQVLAAGWSGGVQIGPHHCDDAAWLELARHIAETGRLPERLDKLASDTRRKAENSQDKGTWSEQPLHAMLARGLGINAVPARSATLLEELHSGRYLPAVAFELAFPEVFFPENDDTLSTTLRRGFDVVLGNPPWEAIRPQRTEFFGEGEYDVAAWAGHTRRERRAAETRLLQDPRIAARFAAYLDQVEGTKRACDRLYERQKLFIDGDLAGRYLDQYRVFLERKAQLVDQGGRVSVVVPASFRANAGAVGLRRLYLLENQPEFLYTFQNIRQTFEIASGMQFCLLSSRFAPSEGAGFETASSLDDEEWLFAAERDPPPLRYTRELLESLGGPHLTVVNLATARDRDITERLVAGTLPLTEHPLFANLPFQTNPAALNATTDSWRLEATESICTGDPRDPAIGAEIERAGFAPLHEKGTISRFQARERQQPRYLVDLRKCADKPDWLLHRQHFRLIGRSAIHAAELDKMVFALIPPGGLVSNSALVESAPHRRPIASALTALSLLNSYVLNYLARQQVVLNLNLFIFRNLRLPVRIPGSTFLARSALRLSAQDEHSVPLRETFFGKTWCESPSSRTWPSMLPTDRTELIAAINAVVAHAYQVDESDYAHILDQGAASATTTERKLSLNLFAELTREGLAAFVKRHDPDADIAIDQPTFLRTSTRLRRPAA